jgi:hypothetical protein
MQRHGLASGQDASGSDLLKLGIEDVLQGKQTGKCSRQADEPLRQQRK